MSWLACWPRTSSRSKDLSTTALYVCHWRPSVFEWGWLQPRQPRNDDGYTTTSLGGPQRVWRLHLDCPTNLKCRRWNASPNAGAWRLQARWRAGPLRSTRSVDWICGRWQTAFGTFGRRLSIRESEPSPTASERMAQAAQKKAHADLKALKFRKPPYLICLLREFLNCVFSCFPSPFPET